MKKIKGEEAVYKYLRRNHKNKHCAFLKIIKSTQDASCSDLGNAAAVYYQTLLTVRNNPTDLIGRTVEVELEYEPKYLESDSRGFYTSQYTIEDFIKLHESEPREFMEDVDIILND